MGLEFGNAESSKQLLNTVPSNMAHMDIGMFFAMTHVMKNHFRTEGECVKEVSPESASCLQDCFVTLASDFSAIRCYQALNAFRYHGFLTLPMAQMWAERLDEWIKFTTGEEAKAPVGMRVKFIATGLVVNAEYGNTDTAFYEKGFQALIEISESSADFYWNHREARSCWIALFAWQESATRDVFSSNAIAMRFCEILRLWSEKAWGNMAPGYREQFVEGFAKIHLETPRSHQPFND